MDLNKYRAESRQALDDLQAVVDQLNKPDCPYNAQGKQDQLNRARQKYAAAVAAVRDRAERELTRERERVEAQRVEVAKGAAKRERALLASGDQVSFLVLLHRLQHLKPAQLIEALDGARDDWERTVIASVGSDLMPDLVGNDPALWQLHGRWNALARQVADPEVSRLDDERVHLHHVEEGLDRLDPVRWAETMGASVGVQPQYILDQA